MKKEVSLSHLRSHFNQHEQLFYADPQTLALHSFSYNGPLCLLKTAQQLWGGDKDYCYIRYQYYYYYSNWEKHSETEDRISHYSTKRWI